MTQMEARGFILAASIEEVRPGESYPFSFAAWTPDSTPPKLIAKAREHGILPPEQVTLDEIFQYPRTAAELYLTRTCALNCTGCSVPVSVRWAKETRQPVRDWMTGIHKLKERGLPAVKFIGGEVGTLDWLSDVAGFAVEEGLHVSIFTDGVPFNDNPERFDRVMTETEGKVLWMTSVDFPPPTEEMRRGSGKQEETARRFKAERGLKFIEKVTANAGSVIGHMMLHQPNKALIADVYDEVTSRGGIFSVGTMQVNAHVYQGRDPGTYSEKLTLQDAAVIDGQISGLIGIEDKNLFNNQKRTIANSRAHLATTATVGIRQNIGCVDPDIGPPAVFAVMPTGSLRHCPVIQAIDQVHVCPGCSYAVFRDGDQRWARYLASTGAYQPSAGIADFPSLFYPHNDNNFLERQYWHKEK